MSAIVMSVCLVLVAAVSRISLVSYHSSQNITNINSVSRNLSTQKHILGNSKAKIGAPKQSVKKKGNKIGFFSSNLSNKVLSEIL